MKMPELKSEIQPASRHASTPPQAAKAARRSNRITVVRIKLAIKTGIAGVIAIFVARWLKLPEGYWAVISALIVMQSNVGATVSASWNRLISTAIGAFMGGLFASFWDGKPLWFGVAVTLTVLACASLNLLESYRLAAVTVAIIMLISRHSTAAVIALHRFTEVSVGIVIGVAVTSLVWPARARDHLRAGMVDVIRTLAALHRAVARRYRGEGVELQTDSIAKLNASLRKNEGLLKEAVYEPNIGRASQELLPLFMQHLERMAGLIQGLEFSSRENRSSGHQLKFEPELGMLMNSVARGLELLAANLQIPRFAPAPDDKWPPFQNDILALDAKMTALRTAGEFRGFELDEILRFYSFLLTLRTLAEEIELASQVSSRLGKSAGAPEIIPEIAA